MGLLIDTIPLLTRSKADLLSFFRGSGVPEATLAMLRTRVATDPDSIKKAEIARTLLTWLNEGSDRTLRQRREVIKRVTAFEDFSVCWPNDRDRAEALVGRIRKKVGSTDSFTKMQMERDRERQDRLRIQEATALAKRQKREQRGELRRRLVGLTSMTDPHRRGIALEGVLNDVFALDGLSVREAFTVRGEDGQVKEQIDGLIALGLQDILVEAKWHAEPIGRADVSPHLVSVYSRGDVYGLYISFSKFTDPAIEEVRNALTQKVVVLAEVREILMLLETEDTSISDWLKDKIRAARVDRNPLCRPGIATPAG